jgi:single-strand DNA-binding protein
LERGRFSPHIREKLYLEEEIFVLNKAILVGRLTKDIDLRSTASGTSVSNFTIAIQRKFKDANGERQSDFINCVAFGKTADFLKSWFSRGAMLSVEGRIQVRNYEDKDGKKVYVTEVIAEDVGFIEGKKEQAEEKEAEMEMPDLPESFQSDDSDSLPF